MAGQSVMVKHYLLWLTWKLYNVTEILMGDKKRDLSGDYLKYSASCLRSSDQVGMFMTLLNLKAFSKVKACMLFYCFHKD